MARPPPHVAGRLGIDGEARPVEQNQIGGVMADALRGTKSGLNTATDYLWGFNAGDLLLGDAPELAEKLSYGDPSIQRTGHGYRLDPAYADLAGVAAIPAAGIMGVTKTATKKGKDLMTKALREGPHDPSKRKTLKTLAGAGAATAATIAAPELAIQALKGGATAAAKTTAGVASKGMGVAGIRALAAGILGTQARKFGKLGNMTDEDIAAKVDPDAIYMIEKQTSDAVEKYGDDFDPDHWKASHVIDRDELNYSQELGMNSPESIESVDWLLDQPNAKELYDHWAATGKWPDSVGNKLDNFDVDTWSEATYSQYWDDDPVFSTGLVDDSQALSGYVKSGTLEEFERPSGSWDGLTKADLLEPTPVKPLALADPAKRKTLKRMAGTAAQAAMPNLGANVAVEALKKSLPAPALNIGDMATSAAEGAISMLKAGTRLEFVEPKVILDMMGPQAIKAVRGKMKELTDKYGDEFDMEGYLKRTNYGPEWVNDKDLGLESWRDSPLRKPINRDVEPNTYKPQWTENPADEYMEHLPGTGEMEVIERWYATGKWPEGKEDIMKYWDRQIHAEGLMDEYGTMYGHEDHLNPLNEELNRIIRDAYGQERYTENIYDSSEFDTHSPWGTLTGDSQFGDELVVEAAQRKSKESIKKMYKDEIAKRIFEGKDPSFWQEQLDNLTASMEDFDRKLGRETKDKVKQLLDLDTTPEDPLKAWDQLHQELNSPKPPKK